MEALRQYKYYESPQTKEKEEEETQENVESKILSSVSVAQWQKPKPLLEHLKRDNDIQIGEKDELIYKDLNIQ